MKRCLLLVPVFAAGVACDPTTTADCEFPEDPVAVSGPIANPDSCGHWLLTVGGHLYVDLAVASIDRPCTVSGLEPPVTMNAPISSDIGGQGPQYTFDFVGAETGGPIDLSITCGGVDPFYARLTVEDAAP